MATKSLQNRNTKLTKKQSFALMQLAERKYSICLTCDGEQITCRDEANEHQKRGHDVVEYCATKSNLVVN
jgi:hypothetical protein